MKERHIQREAIKGKERDRERDRHPEIERKTCKNRGEGHKWRE